MSLKQILTIVFAIGWAAPAAAEDLPAQATLYSPGTVQLEFVRHGCGAGKHRVRGQCVTDPGRAGFRFSTRTGFGAKCRHEYRLGEKVRICR